MHDCCENSLTSAFNRSLHKYTPVQSFLAREHGNYFSCRTHTSTCILCTHTHFQALCLSVSTTRCRCFSPSVSLFLSHSVCLALSLSRCLTVSWSLSLAFTSDSLSLPLSICFSLSLSLSGCLPHMCSLICLVLFSLHSCRFLSFALSLYLSFFFGHSTTHSLFPYTHPLLSQ